MFELQSTYHTVLYAFPTYPYHCAQNIFTRMMTSCHTCIFDVNELKPTSRIWTCTWKALIWHHQAFSFYYHHSWRNDFISLLITLLDHDMNTLYCDALMGNAHFPHTRMEWQHTKHTQFMMFKWVHHAYKHYSQYKMLATWYIFVVKRILNKLHHIILVCVCVHTSLIQHASNMCLFFSFPSLIKLPYMRIQLMSPLLLLMHTWHLHERHMILPHKHCQLTQV